MTVGLEPTRPSDLLWVVSRQGMPERRASVLIVFAATAGALLGFGLRLGSGALPFNAVASLALGRVAARSGAVGWATLVGVVIHGVGALAWTTLGAALARRVGGRIVLAALLTALVAVLAMLLAQRVMSVGPAVILGTGQQLALGLVLAAALVVGMRFAPPPP